MNDRDFQMSNAQIFTYLLYAPVCLAVASDRQVDEEEIRLLEKITKGADVNSAVNINLMEVIAIAPEPSDIMLNEEFNMRVDAELLYLSRNMDKYETVFIDAVKTLLKLDKDPKSDTSLSTTFSKWFEFRITSYNVCYTKLLRVFPAPIFPSITMNLCFLFPASLIFVFAQK